MTTSSSKNCLSPAVTELLLTTLCVSGGAYFGAYVRVAIGDETSFYPNLLGSFLIGVTAPIKSWVGYGKTGFTTGFCGSLTTYSAWIYFWSNQALTDGITAGESIRDLLAFLGIYLIGYVVGRDAYHFLNIAISTRKPPSEIAVDIEGSSPPKLVTPPWCAKFWRFLSLASAVAWLPVTGVIIYLVVIENKTAYAILFSQFGAIMRWQLGKLNRPKFCFGTLAANTIAVLSLTLANVYGPVDNLWLYGFNSGFCACLSTVSSFIKDTVTVYEKKTTPLAKIWSFGYVAATFGLALTIALVIIATK